MSRQDFFNSPIATFTSEPIANVKLVSGGDIDPVVIAADRDGDFSHKRVFYVGIMNRGDSIARIGLKKSYIWDSVADLVTVHLVGPLVSTGEERS